MTAPAPGAARRRKKRIGKALASMAGARLLAILAMAVGFIVLSRLLPPSDFGVYALAYAGFGAARVLAEFGMREYAIRHERALTRRSFGAATALSAGMAAFGALLLVTVPALLGDVLPDGLHLALVPMALALFVEPLILSREARLHRSIAFDVPAAAAVTGVVADVATAIALALNGFGVMALAWGMFAGQLARGVTIVLFTPRPRLGRPARAEFAPLLRFGGRQAGLHLLPQLTELLMLTSLTAGGGAAVTGFYNRARKVTRLLDETLMEGIAPAILPAFSDILRSGGSPADLVAGKTCRLLPVVVPGFLGIALLAEPLVAVLLGPGWDETVPAIQLLAIGGLAGPFTMMAFKAFTAYDRVDAFARIQTITLATQLVLASAAAFVSLTAFCAAIAASRWLKAGLILRWQSRHLGLDENARTMRLSSALAITAGTLAGPAMLTHLVELPPLALLGASGSLALAGWLVTLWLTRHPLWDEFGLTLTRNG
jgi:O-antigen/teichoic acid export membrane protein